MDDDFGFILVALHLMRLRYLLALLVLDAPNAIIQQFLNRALIFNSEIIDEYERMRLSR